MATIKNLAFKGGGVLGIAYAGAIQVLQDKQILQGIERVAGTSAGAITAMLVSLRYSAEDIKGIVNSTSFKKFEDGKSYLRILTKYGLYSGDAALKWIGDQIEKKGFPRKATFRDFHAKGCRDLHVFATDLNKMGLQKFSCEDTPDVVVAEAVRASMSIPMFFKAWKFSNNNPNDHLYVDGGMIYNFPIDIFDNGEDPNPETLGVYLANLSQKSKANNLKYWELFQYVKITFETILDAQAIDFMNDPSQKDRSIVIDDLGISPTDFNLSPAQEDALYQSGVKYAEAYFGRQGA